MNRFCYTGTVEGVTTPQMGTVFIWMLWFHKKLKGAEIHHHDYLSSWDKSFHEQTAIMGVKRVCHPGKGLVDVIGVVDVVVANPRTRQPHPGSWHWNAIECARRLGKRIIIVHQDGTWTEEPDEPIDTHDWDGDSCRACPATAQDFCAGIEIRCGEAG